MRPVHAKCNLPKIAVTYALSVPADAHAVWLDVKKGKRER